VETPHVRPSALGAWPEIAARLRGRRVVVFLDYDGTLTPIVDTPDRALLPDETRDVMRALGAVLRTVIVSGRGREDVASLVGLEHLVYAGSHGFDIGGLSGATLRHEVASELREVIARACEALQKGTDGVPGALIENKTFSVAVHFRLVSEEQVPRLERLVDDLVRADSRLRKTHGKKVFEIRPAVDWDKGRAVLWLLTAFDMDGPDVMPIYVGDDVTDEDAFRSLHGRGIGVLVGHVARPSAAEYALRDPDEVRAFLDRLVRLHGGGAP